MLADLRANEEEESFQDFVDEFAAINKVLRAAGLPEHREPVDLGEEDGISYDMIGYSGLHYLRRIAAHVWDGRGRPPPGSQESPRDPVMDRYYATIDRPQSKRRLGLFRRPPQERPNFDHLMQHSDADGFYLPLRFQSVLFADPALEIAGEMIGSGPLLMEECTRLAALLELPLDLDPESEEVWQAVDNQGQGLVPWKRYGIESFTCLRLYHACRVSVHLGAALVFM